MDKIFVKICGITDNSDALYACRCGADAVGFIAYPKSKRYIKYSETKKIIKNLCECHTGVLRVGVFVNEAIVNIEKYIDAGVDVVQLHGDEDDEYIDKVKKINKEIQIWKAVRLKNKEEVENIKKLDVDKILIDTYSAEEYGGSGKTGDWGLAKFTVNQLDKPVILAGGLNPGNIRCAIESVKPFGIDLSSGVEISLGRKDHKLIYELFKRIN
jgi:phosphoribosylanthranilate isomerase